VLPVRYNLGFYIPEDGILHSHCRGNLKSYIALTGCALQRRRIVLPARYKLGFYIPEDGILHSHRRENLKSYMSKVLGNAEYNIHWGFIVSFLGHTGRYRSDAVTTFMY
jgi:hypothetical protein